MTVDPLRDEPVVLVVADQDAGLRLDAFLAARLPSYSRVQLRRAVLKQYVTVDDSSVKAAHRLRTGQRVVVRLPDAPQHGTKPEEIPLDVLFEDEDLIAINKPPGMVVHPARGHWSGTLAAALAYHFDRLSQVGGSTRPGIVHRLDRDTSGVIVVAKHDAAHMALAAQFEQRTVQKQYVAIVCGHPDHDSDLIDLPIGAHPYQRERMAIRANHPTARPAQTFYQVEHRFRGFAWIRAHPKTGRTHQIRLHLAHIGCPVLCDRLYGGRAQISLGELTTGREDAQIILQRQALHADRIRLQHPTHGESIEFTAPIPADIQQVLDHLGQHRQPTY